MVSAPVKASASQLVLQPVRARAAGSNLLGVSEPAHSPVPTYFPDHVAVTECFSG